MTGKLEVGLTLLLLASVTLPACVRASLLLAEASSSATVHVAPPTDSSPHEVRFVAVEPGVHLEVLDWGGIGAPLVLLAGMGATAHTFDDFAPTLTDHFRVLAITRRGFGASSQPESGYHLDTLARDVRVVLDSLGIDRAVLAGHSYGAGEAIRLAARWPDRAASLVSLDGMLLVDIERLLQVMGEVPAPPSPGESEHASVAAYGDYMARIYGVHLPEAEIRARWHVLPDGRVGEEVTPDWIPLAILQGTNATPLDDFRIPLLGIRHVPTSAAALIPWYGEMSPDDRERADAAFPALEQFAADGWAPLTQLAGARIVELLDANHHPYISHPREVLRAMRDFLLGSMALPAAGASGSPADTVHVAPPTGERERDRASILAALEQVQPEGTVLFAAGTYFMGGEIFRVTVPRVTLLGNPDGTTLRGCEPGEFPWEDITEFGNNCNAIELAAGQQTVRNLTFEHAFWALHVGCCWDALEKRGIDGGHLIEGNTFRNSSNAVRVHGFWSEPTVIRNNVLLNNWHSVQIYGGTVHLLDNDISVPEPEAVQLWGFPMEGVHLASPFDLHESVQGVRRTCDNNVIAGNRIEGVTEGIMVTANEPGIICRNNVIRDNTIIVRRARPPTMPGFIGVNDPGDSTVIGVPLALRGVAGENTLEDNLIEGNVIAGAEGLGIEIRNASRNRIGNNSVTGVVRREPFPGNSFIAMPLIGGDPEAWRDANGAGIWISAGSDENEIVGNAFEGVASHAVVLNGDRNRVETRSPADAVRDLGAGNQVSVGVGPRGVDTGRRGRSRLTR